MNGIIIVDKPPHKTSHDVVGFIRRLTGIRKVGHTGTLDPDATGVLPICIGRATKASDMLTETDKRYVTQLVLGRTTDTQDMSGTVLTENPVNVTEEGIKNAVSGFIGEIEQIPPMFSAIKKDGKKLYELARKGISVERQPRRITVYGIDILEIDTGNNTVTLDIKCSKGTYIRTLCADIGEMLGCGACMNTLRRTESAGFDISESHTTEELERLSSEGRIGDALIPLDEIFGDCGKLRLDARLSKKVKSGIKITSDKAEDGKLYRLYDENNAFLCISECKNGDLIMKKAFWVD